MKPKLNFYLIIIVLTCMSGSISAQNSDSILDAIGRTLPQLNSGWTFAIGEAWQRDDGTRQASIKWNKGTAERSATVVIYPTVKSAQQAFRPSGKEDLQEEFRIDGIGDEAFLWPPKTPEGGAYNLRFRKAQVEIWMGGTEEEVKAHAVRIAAAIGAKKYRG